MGIITDLLRQHSDKQLKDKTTALDGYRTLLTLPDQVLPPETKNWALDNILNLSGDVTGGGKGGKKGGGVGGGGKDQSANPFRSILAAMSGLNPVPAAPKSIGNRPDQLLRSPDQQKQYAADQAQAERGEKEKDFQGQEDIRRKSAVRQYQEETPEVVAREQARVKAQPKLTAFEALRDEYAATGMSLDEASKKAGAVLSRTAETKSEPKPKPASAIDKMSDNIEEAGIAKGPAARQMAAKLLYDQAKKKLDTTGGTASGTSGILTEQDLRSLAEGSVIYGLGRPSFGLSAKNPNRERYFKAEAEVMRDQGGAGAVAGERAGFKADTQSLQQLVKNQATVKAMENGTNTEIDRAIALSKAVPRSQAHLLNGLLQRGEKELTDYPQLARFREAVLAARNRYASMISTARGGGGAVTNAARQEADEVINAAMAQGSFEGAAQEMKVGIQNVMKGLEDEVKQKRGEMIRQNGGGGTAGGSPQSPAGVPKVGDTFGGGKVLSVEKVQ